MDKREEKCLQRDPSHSAYSKKQISWNCLSHIFPQKHVHYWYHSTHFSRALIWITNVHWGPVTFQALKKLDIRIVKGLWHISISPVVHSVVRECLLHVNLFIYTSLLPMLHLYHYLWVLECQDPVLVIFSFLYITYYNLLLIVGVQ